MRVGLSVLTMAEYFRNVNDSIHKEKVVKILFVVLSKPIYCCISNMPQEADGLGTN